MLLTLAVGLALVQGGPYRTDTTVAVREGARLALAASSGEITLRAWNRNEVRIRASHSANTRVEIRNTGAVLRLEAHGRMGMPGRTDFELTVPAWMSAEMDGMNFNLDAEGITGGVKASTLNGDLVARNVGDVAFNTMSGDIRVESARGRLAVSAVSGRIQVTGATGDIEAQSVSGDIGLYKIESQRVAASSLSGVVIYEGAVRDHGSYALGTHSGTVTFTMPERANATVNGVTMSGDLSASFALPMMDQRSRGRTMIRFGNGSAAVDLESFSGTIRLVRPGEAPQLPTRSRSRGDRTRDHGDWDGNLDLDLALGLAPAVLHELDLGEVVSASVHAGLAALASISVEFRDHDHARRPAPRKER